MTRRWFDGTVTVVLLTLIAVGGLVKPWATKKLNSDSDNIVAETVSVMA